MKRSELALTFLLLPLDALAIFAAGLTAYAARFHPALAGIRPVIFQLPLENYATVLSLAVLLWILVFALAGLYGVRPRPIKKEMARLLLASAASMTAIFSVLFFSRSLFESRFIVLAGWGLAIIFVGLERLAVRLLQRALLSTGVGVHRVAVIGKNKTAEALIKEFKNHGGLGFKVVANFKNYNLQTQKELEQLHKKDLIDEILLVDPDINREDTLELLAFTDSQHLGFKYTADLFAMAIGRTDIGTYAGIPVVEIKKTPLDGWGAIYKRAFDILFSSLLIIFSSPILIVTIIALAIEDRFPVIFQNVRVGERGQNFKLYKLRSMWRKFCIGPQFKQDEKKNLELEKQLIKEKSIKEGPVYKIADDPRITKVGKFIRKWSIDELPQFFNVLKGDMSLVGPRPHQPREVESYLPHHRRILAIHPGVTGLAQISGRSDLDFEDEVRLDTYYIEHWSPWLDLTILFKTPLVVIFKKGAY